MRNSLYKYSQKDDLQTTTDSASQKNRSQHGLLLDVPAETLTCITSHLEPPSLLSLAQVNVYLNHHVADENTWRRAFVCQFLGIGPQLDFNSKHTLLLRRSESSWRNEFIIRYRLRRRWERSRNPTISHIPVHSTISAIHQMPSNTLLTSSLQYGIVARSIPLTGKILSGYLDASGSAAGQGIGNPNAEFTPNISACAISFDGGTAKLVWGSTIGRVLFMTVPRVMNTGRPGSADVRTCRVVDEHEAAVTDAVWLTLHPIAWVLSAGVDARVKIWDPKSAFAVWTSQQVFNSVVPDACLKVAGSAYRGYVIGVFKSGHVRIWTGFDFTQPIFNANDVKEIIVDNPIRTSTDAFDSSANHDVTILDHDPFSDHLSVLVGYHNDCYFYRIQVDLSTMDVQMLAFGSPHSGSISTIAPFFQKDDDKTQSSVIFAGDQLGCISLYEWDADLTDLTDTIGPLRIFEAHRDGVSVTSIAWNGLVLVSGSVRGEARVFDGISFEALRSFESVNPRLNRRVIATGVETEREKVEQILIGPEKDIVFFAIGNRIMAWKAGAVPKYVKGGVRGRNNVSRGKKGGQGAKNFDYLTQDIIESQDIMEDEAVFAAGLQRSRGREHDQRQGLATLGLSEVEAVEYVLMLSRDEANERGRNEASAGIIGGSIDVDEGVFEGDGMFFGSRRPRTLLSTSFNDGGGIDIAPSVVSSALSESESSLSSISSGLSSMTTIPISRSIMRSPSLHHSSSSTSASTKVQISPRYRVEPLQAGVEWGEAETRGDGTAGGTRLGLADHYFPPIGGDERGGLGFCSITPNLSPKDKDKDKKAVPSSSAWSIPLTKKLSLSSSRLDALPSPSPSAWSSVLGVASGSARDSAFEEQEKMDDESTPCARLEFGGAERDFFT